MSAGHQRESARTARQRHRVVVEGESSRPPKESAALIDGIARRIEPDLPALEVWFSRYREEHLERLARDLDLVGRLASPGAQLLEYGSVPLLMTAALSARGYRVSGLDIAPQRFARTIDELQLDVRSCDVETEPVPFADATFDLVLFCELFEHLRVDPIFTLREVHRVLRPGGRLLLSTPNLRSFRGIRNLVLRNQGHACSAGVYRQYEKLETLGHMGHVREYTTREVSDFLTRVGFRVDRIVFRGGHGSGPVGLAERLAPSLRPFFSIVASRDER